MAERTLYCLVDGCWNTEGHVFPKDESLRKKWLSAIKKDDSLKIASDSIVCLEHFTVQDYVKEDFAGIRPLVKDAIPSVFDNQILALPTVEERLDNLEREIKSDQTALKRKLDLQPSYKKRANYRSVTCQTQRQSLISHTDFCNRPTYIVFYTGLDSHEKFIYVYHTLGPTVDHLGNQAVSVTLEDQFFLTLMKLRRNTADIELALFFNINLRIVKNIVISWIQFMASEWSELNTWPSKELAHYYSNELTGSVQKCEETDSAKPEFPKLADDLSDQEGFSKSVYVKKLIKTTKMYEIMRNKLEGYCLPFEREIMFICSMLCHYRKSVL